MVINRLIKLIGSCDLEDVASLRRLYEEDSRYEQVKGNKYEYDGVTIECDETYRNTPEYVKFKIGFPLDILGINSDSKHFEIMTSDYCLREFVKQTEKISLERNHATGKEKFTGKIYIQKPNEKVILRNNSFIEDDILYIIFVVRFPVHMMSKRNVVAGKLSVKIIRKELAYAIRDFIKFFNIPDYEAKAEVYNRQQEIRHLLIEKDLISFIANNSILPRNEEGLALKNAVPFISPPEDEIEIVLSNGFTLKGMGIKKGVTVITGGGYSGKSTLLDGMLHGIYNHIPGDGREYCITQEQACKIISEDGRSVKSLDISPFIRNTGNLNTDSFSTRHASGSTSQAANIMEALSFGCNALLIDEDRTATNFMIRDSRMKQIIKDDPIIPFTDRVRQIYKETGISTILIIGGSGEYLDLADNVFIMKDYHIYNYNKEINITRQNNFNFYTVNDEFPVKWKQERIILKEEMSVFKRDDEAGKIREYLFVTDEEIHLGIYKADVSRLNTIISKQQMTAIAFIIRTLFNNQKSEKCCLYTEIEKIYNDILINGFKDIYSNKFGIDFNMELPAMHDILFTISRMFEFVPYQK